MTDWRRCLVFVLSALACAAPACAALPARAADDAGLTRMATCADSWLDWQKANDARLKTFGDRFRTSFTRKADDPFFVPKSPMTVGGFRIVRAFPDSVGMGVGFSLFVAADFATAKRSFERTLGKALKCETGDGMRSCELALAPMRTFTLAADDNPKSTETLIGCYYYYEK